MSQDEMEFKSFQDHPAFKEFRERERAYIEGQRELERVLKDDDYYYSSSGQNDNLVSKEDTDKAVLVIKRWFITFLPLFVILTISTIISLIINGMMFHNMKNIIKMAKTPGDKINKLSHVNNNSFNYNPYFQHFQQ